MHYVYTSHGQGSRAQHDNTGVCEKAILLWKPWPSNPVAETAFQPLIWCSESLYSPRRGVFFTDTGMALKRNHVRTLRLERHTQLPDARAGEQSDST